MFFNSFARSSRLLAVTVLAIFSVSGCGEGDGQASIAGTPGPALAGVLVDAPVWGVSWDESSGLFGITNAEGQFQYRPLQTVTFYIGDIILGTVQGAPVISPVELTGSIDPTDQAAVNLAVFLQSLDNDSNPSNGIFISDVTRVRAAGMTLDFTAADFSTQVAAVVAAITDGNEVVSEADALNNFYSTYAELGGTDTFGFDFPGYPPVGGGVTYELVFADEFNAGTTPNPDNWTIETGYGPGDSGWGNDEWQLYTDSSENVRVEDGNLVLSALCPVAPCGVRDGTITSGKINSLDKFNFRYGKVIARIKPPVGEAAWPAFWSLGTNFPEIGWPRSGEIDFMEVHNFFSDENTTHFTMHWWDDLENTWEYDSQYLTTAESLGDDYHIFEADWDENRIVGKIDGRTYFTRAIDPDTMEEFFEEFYMILNVAMGGTLGSNRQPPSGNETFPQTMLVDYVRVFQAAGGDTGGGTEDVVLATFDEATPPAVTEFGGAGWAIEAGPAGGDGNALRITRDGGEVWAGAWIAIPAVPNDAGEQTISALVYSPTAGIPMVAKVEYADNSGSGEVPANETVVEGWQTLTWTFTNLAPPNIYNRFVLLPNLGNVGAGESYYIDNITLLGTGGSGTPDVDLATFDEATPPEVNEFGGAGWAIEAGPAGGDGNALRITRDGGEVWAGAWILIPAVPNDAGEQTISALVYSPTAGIPMVAKLEYADNSGSGEVPANEAVVEGWQTLTWTFTNLAPPNIYNRFVLLPNLGNVGAGESYYIDNITLLGTGGGDTGGGDTGGGDAPTTAAPAPTADAGTVTSVFSDVYTDPTGVNYNPDWGQATVVTTESIAGNDVLKLAGLNYQGIDFATGGAALDVSGHDTLHIDFWTADATAVNVYLISTGPVETAFALPITTGSWQSVDIPLSSFDPVNLADVIQMKFDDATTGESATIFIDNLYFYTDAGGTGGGDAPTVAAPTPPARDAADVVSLFSDAYTDVTVDTWKTDWSNATFADVDIAGNATKEYTNLGFVGIETVASQLDLAGATHFHVDVWTPNADLVKVKLVDFGADAGFGGTDDTEAELVFDATSTPAITQGEWISLDIPLADFEAAGLDNRSHVAQLIFSGEPFGDVTLYVDNVYFYNDGGGTGGPAAIALPVTFEDGDATFYELTDFGGAATSLVADPTDAGNTVASTDKFAGSQTWAGTTVANATGFGALPFSATDTTMTLRVYSPDVGIPVRLKVEDVTDAGVSVETEAITTASGAWETLTFDFASQAAGTAALDLTKTYDKASVFFNFGTDGIDGKTYLWDDLTFVTGGGGGSVSTDFEGGSYSFSDFGGAVAAVVANPDASGINVSTQVAQMQKFAGELFAGSTLDLGGPVDLAAGDSYTMKVLAQRSVVVTFKLETGGQETTADYSGSGTWEELCFDFTGVAATVTGITVIFDNGTAGDAANFPDDWTFQFDDIQQVASCPPTGGGPLALPVTFEDGDATFYELTDFGGAATSLVADPADAGNTVASTDKFAGSQTWAGTTVANATGFGALPFSATDTTMTLRVYSPDVGIPVRLKVEDVTDAGVSVETEAITTASGAWETLTFDFASQAAGTAALDLTKTYDKASVFFNFGTDGIDGKTYLWDDLTFVTGGGGPAAIALPVTFEDGDATFYELTDFGGAATSLVADPADAGNTVASTDKFAGSQTWAGTTVANATGFGALPFSATDTTMTLRVYSPDVGIPVRLKVEDVTDAGVSVETEAITTASGAWETLTFDFASQAAGTAALDLTKTYDKASVFFNFGTDGIDGKTYLWDDLTFVTGGGGPAAIALPVTFEDGDATFYELTDFGGAATSLVADPADAGNTVASTDKFAGSQTWAGTTVANATGFGALPFSATDTTMTLRVYSPDVGIPVRLKVEDVTDAGVSVETEAITTASGAWETLTFDFASQAAGTAALDLTKTYDKASVFFNFGTDGIDGKTYLWDDLTFVTGGGGGSVSTDFEGGSYSFSDFGGAVAAVVANPDASGINVSTQVAQMQKFAGELFAGSTLDLGGPVDLAAGDSYTMKVLAQRSVVVTFKLETGGQETTADYSGSGTWEELCFDFTGVAATVTGITVIFDNGTAGDAANFPDDWTFQFDDIQQVASCPPTGGGPLALPVTFEDGDATFYELTDFGGAATSLVADPADAGNTVASTDKFAGSQTWAGTTVANATGFGALPFSATDTTMTLRVYSPDVGIPVRLKVEDVTDAGVSVETEAITTASGAWETLTFDFASQAAGTAALDLTKTYDKASVFFNFGTDGIDGKTYLWDDLTFVTGGGGPAAIALPVTFEDGDATFYELTDFGGAATSLVADPADAGNTVASTDKFAGSQTWAGTTVANATGFGALPFSATDTTMTLRVYSPDVGIPVRLKVEDVTDAGVSVETEAITTASGAWETLTFDFASQAAGTAALDLTKTYDKASVFFNFGTDGIDGKTYLWDDLTFVTGGGGGASGELAVNGGFETGDLTGWTVFDSSNSPNGGTISVTSPGSTGTFAGNLNITAPGNPTLKQANLAAGQLTPNQVVTVTFDWKGTDANGGVANIVLFSELGAGGVSDTYTIFDGPGFPADWTTVGPLDITTGNDVSGGVTLQIAAICGGAAGCISEVFIDNVSVTVP